MRPVTRIANAKYSCVECSEFIDADALEEIEDFQERVAAGDTMPAGECPLCGGLVHIASKINSGTAAEEVTTLRNILSDVVRSSDANCNGSLIYAIQIAAEHLRKSGLHPNNSGVNA